MNKLKCTDHSTNWLARSPGRLCAPGRLRAPGLSPACTTQALWVGGSPSLHQKWKIRRGGRGSSCPLSLDRSSLGLCLSRGHYHRGDLIVCPKSHAPGTSDLPTLPAVGLCPGISAVAPYYLGDPRGPAVTVLSILLVPSLFQSVNKDSPSHGPLGARLCGSGSACSRRGFRSAGSQISVKEREVTDVL